MTNPKKRKGDGNHNDTITGLKIQLAHPENEFTTLKQDYVELKTDYLETVVELKALKRENQGIKDEFNVQRGVVDAVYKSNNELEQYTRRNNMRIFGLKDTNPAETAAQTEQIVGNLITKLGYKIHPSEVEVAHRTGRWSRD